MELRAGKPYRYRVLQRDEDSPDGYDEGLQIFKDDQPYINVNGISEEDFIRYFVPPEQREQILARGLSGKDQAELMRLNFILKYLNELRLWIHSRAEFPYICGLCAEERRKVLEIGNFADVLTYRKIVPDSAFGKIMPLRRSPV